MGISIIFTMGIPILVRQHRNIETTPQVFIHSVDILLEDHDFSNSKQWRMSIMSGIF